MRIEIVLFLIVGFLIMHIYTEGKYFKRILSYKKYIQMGGIVFAALIIYWLIKKNPNHAKNIIMTSNEYIKYLPVDKNTTSMIAPILDFTANHSYSGGAHTSGQDAYQNGLNQGYENPILQMPNSNTDQYANRIMRSGQVLQTGKKGTKRSVSETKKKFVASRQSWKCGDCGDQLNAWFEVDHKIRLEYGGSNHVDNLVALCRECHGKKTTIENL